MKFINKRYPYLIEIVKIGVEVEYMLAQTNKCREPIYIENLLCQLLI
jgi:hypothetical protein